MLVWSLERRVFIEVNRKTDILTKMVYSDCGISPLRSILLVDPAMSRRLDWSSPEISQT